MALIDLRFHPSLHLMVVDLQHPVLTIGSATITLLDVLDLLLSVVTVWLVVRQHPLSWPIGIVDVMMFWAILMDDVQYVPGPVVREVYVSAGWRAVCLAVMAWGWWAWLYGDRDGSGRVLQRTSSAEWLVFAGAGTVMIGLLAWAMDDNHRLTTTLWDAAAMVIALFALYGWGRKLVESWWLWIASDLILILLYAYRGLRLTSGFNNLYVTVGVNMILLVSHIVGLAVWQRAWAAQRPPAAQPVAAWSGGMR